ncbi:MULTISPECIES: hypothetical protein [unclassified Sphingomonas]|uniref:hypothetical protein n=1 Tax=unclassified Sphingomonas TaxID=196159 RepID=UPI000ADEBAF3|nr:MULTISPECIES: hypothetical protein [unclassified Sphingomonas]
MRNRRPPLPIAYRARDLLTPPPAIDECSVMHWRWIGLLGVAAQKYREMKHG